MIEPTPDAPVLDAVILMAGVGSRLGSQNGALAKPLISIRQRPLISYTFAALESVGVRRVHAVMGAASDRLPRELEPLLPGSMRLLPIMNPQWQKQNGVSVLCAAGKVHAPFFLTMGDHLFEPSILAALLKERNRGEVNLAVDHKLGSIFDMDDATKVRTEDERVVAIGKDLRDYDAIDTGVFLCSDIIFNYLRIAQHQNGDCSLSDGIRLMAAERKVYAVDIGNAWWQDVDTPEMLARAEEESARLLRNGGSRLAQESVASES